MVHSGLALCGAGLPQDQRTRCEVWTRVMGYHRPVHAFNAGKRAEHAERRPFRESGPWRGARYRIQVNNPAGLRCLPANTAINADEGLLQ